MKLTDSDFSNKKTIWAHYIMVVLWKVYISSVKNNQIISSRKHNIVPWRSSSIEPKIECEYFGTLAHIKQKSKKSLLQTQNKLKNYTVVALTSQNLLSVKLMTDLAK